MMLGMGDASFSDVIVRNVRAARARRHLDQADVVARMHVLGYKNWHRQTLSKTERGERRLLAEELLALSLALETEMANLLLPSPGELRLVTLPAGQIVILPLQHEMAGGTAGSVLWDGNKPKFSAPGPAEVES
jgi:transcriptional regulator with XRE-family HTH domain